MPCCLLILAAVAPRFAIVLTVLFSDVIGDAFQGGILLPFAGFLFLPATTLTYALAIDAHGAVEGIYTLLVVVALLLDLGVIGGGHYSRRKRKESSA